DRAAQKLAGDVLRRLKFSNDELAAASAIVGAASATLGSVAEWTDAELRRLLGDVTRAHAPAAIAAWRADGAVGFADRAAAILARGDALAVGELAVGGAELMRALDLQPGPAIGRMLVALLERVLDDPALNTREQ